MDRAAWLAEVAKIKQWSRAGERAPHKPLLLLFVLGRLHRTGTSRVTFAEAEPAVADLLRSYGPPRKTSPAYPFHHLQSDGLWRVTTEDGSDPGSSLARLRASGAAGTLAPAFEAALAADPGLLALTARVLLDSNFPESLHDDICQLVGIDVEAIEIAAAGCRVDEVRRRRRDPMFREHVLVAYEYRCAVCRYDGRIGAEAVGLDAAHVRWWAYDGPDSVENGLCLCAIHHKLFDRGVIGLTADRTVQVSRLFVGHSDAAHDLVLRHAGRAVAEPQPGLAPVDDQHIAWHDAEVFRKPARGAA